MSSLDRVFSGSMAEVYDGYLVPLIFEEFADDLAARAAASAPGAVLETAAGSGVVTRSLAPRLSADARYVVTDLNEPMLSRAMQRQGEDARIRWQAADAQTLPFEDGTFDAVVCQFGVMFFPDRVAAFAEARRVLRPGGTFVFNTWDAIEANEFADVVTRVCRDLYPDDPPSFLARTPHGYHDVRAVRADLAAAGFDDVYLETLSTSSRAPSPRHPAVAYCQGTPLRSELEARDPAGPGRATEEAAAVIAARYGCGVVAAPIRGHVAVALR